MSPFEGSIESILSKYFGLSGSIKPLPGEIDLNFLLEDADKKKYTLKVANASEKIDNLEFQNSLMTHLSSKGLGLEIPRVVKSKDGDQICNIKDSKGRNRLVRLLTWVEGRPLAKVRPHSDDLLTKVGALCGKLSHSLADFEHPAAHRFIKWDLAQIEWIRPHINTVEDSHRKQLLEYFYQMNQQRVSPLTARLRKSIIYNDANDYNILVSEDPINPVVPGVIDFGDAVFTYTVNELAIAIAYTVMGKPDPLTAACLIVKGYHEIYPLGETELEALFPLVTTRLIISVICSMLNLEEHPDNTYLQVSDQQAWDLLDKLSKIHPSLAYYSFRSACGMAPHPGEKQFCTWAGQAKLSPVIDWSEEKLHWLDLGIGSLDLGNQAEVLDGEALHRNIIDTMRRSGKEIGVGRYNEVRPFYTSKAFEQHGNYGPEWRTVHLGLDLFVPETTPIFSPLDATVAFVADNAGDRNYGPTIMLRHDVEPGLTFYTLYGHLTKESINKLQVGDSIKTGSKIGAIGTVHENGGWAPHLHFQVILDPLDSTGDYIGVALPSQRKIWTSICPDPWWLIANRPSENQNDNLEGLISYRSEHLGKNLSLSYRKPLHVLRGFQQFLYDDAGQKFLDTVNNVAHVGHEHPRVVRAGQRQMAVLNTNTRYLHKNIIDFTEAILSTMPAGLDVVYLVNSGSEANELALRMARTYTGNKDMLAVEVGYHGNTSACVEVSAYKFNGKGGKGAPEHTHIVPIPDTFRGLYRDKADASKLYASHIEEAINTVKSKGRNIAGFICESVLSCGGQIVLPDGYLRQAYQAVRASGGVCIADEVQTGCGRAGTHFWAFETQNVVPDIVTIGKPIGNGHPLGVVVTSRKLADAFANGMEYFNTFGGNPVSSAIGLEVLRIIKDEGLQESALTTSSYLRDGLLDLKSRHPIIGDVRGLGLFLGIELITDENKSPGTAEASYLANRMRGLGVLMSTDGPFENVLKIKPPLLFNTVDADFLIATLDRVLSEDLLNRS